MQFDWECIRLPLSPSLCLMSLHQKTSKLQWNETVCWKEKNADSIPGIPSKMHWDLHWNPHFIMSAGSVNKRSFTNWSKCAFRAKNGFRIFLWRRPHWMVLSFNNISTLNICDVKDQHQWWRCALPVTDCLSVAWSLEHCTSKVKASIPKKCNIG